MELAYVGVQVRDRAAFDQFLGDIMGLLPGDDHEGASTWRNDDRAYRIFVEDGPADDMTVLGLEHSPEDFGAAVDRARQSGATVEVGDSDLAGRRQVDEVVRVSTPWGASVELVKGLATAKTSFDSPLVPGGFLTSGVGFGHVVLQLTGEDVFDDAHQFATKGLGFEQSDWFEGSIGPASVLARFYHCNARHHTLALARVPGQPPRVLNHIMLETVSEENVGAAFDRAYLGDVTIESGLGRHDNDRMFSFYVETPAGFRMEFGYGAREIVEPWTENRRYDRPSIWGHRPVAPTQLV